MEKYLVTILTCVLVFCNPSWGGQNEPQDFVGSFLDLALDVVTTPCSLLAACLGLDASPCTYQQDQKMRCTPWKKTRDHPCVYPATRRSVNPVSPPNASSVSLSKSAMKPAKFSEPLSPLYENGSGRSTPLVSKSVTDTVRFPKAKVETSAPYVPEKAPVPSTAIGPVASPLKPQDKTKSEPETPPQKDTTRPLLPEVIPLNPDNFVSQQPETANRVKQPIASENGVAVKKSEAPLPTSEVVVPKALPKTEKSIKDKPLQRSKFRQSPCEPVYPPVCGPRVFYR